MKYLNYTIACAVILLIANACKRNEVQTPDFDVSVSKSSFKVNESVLFDFVGNPDNLIFFSGEKGNNYEYRSRAKELGTPVLKFSSSRANGTQTGSLALMVSSDFSGVGASETETVANLAKATWIDITNRALLSSGPLTSSGNIDLTDIARDDKPVYIAFRYTASAGTIQPKWSISELSVNNTLADASVYTIVNLTATAITNYETATIFSPGWVSYKVKNNYNWVISSGKSLVITGATTAVTSTAAAEAWTFTGPVDLWRVSPDVGIFVKDMTTQASSYNFKYSNSGAYSAAFVASKNNVYGKAESVRRINITVE